MPDPVPEVSASRENPLARVFRAFTYRDFRLLWFGAFTSSSGTWLQETALAWLLPGAMNWLVFDAVWGRAPASACDAVRGQGACWAVVWEKFRVMMFGTYPYEEQWRSGLAIIVLCALLLLSTVRRLWNLWLLAIWTVGIVLTFWLMGGGFGLTPVRTGSWGGLPVTLILAIFGIAFAFPLGILLALGRRSNLPIVKSLSVVYIEVVRGVPLITVLFMASVMLPLFLPPGVSFDKLLRALVGVALFSSAYMAEVVRGGLQAIPKGQTEGAMALGLSYWQMMIKIILPQALKISIPNIVGNFISLFKDTTLVETVGLIEFLGVANLISAQPDWLGVRREPCVCIALV